MKIRYFVVIGAALVLIDCRVSQAQTDDHLHCYKFKDTIRGRVVADLNSEQFGLSSQCTISVKGRTFCVPATKTVVAPDPDLTEASVPGRALRDDRICYKVKCPKVDIADQSIADQFGIRPASKFKTATVCTPAVKILLPFCGDDALDEGEECDGSQDDACPDLCRPDCSCVPGLTETLCGNGIVDAAEDCDFGSLGGETCLSQGFSAGVLACGADCTFNTSGCVADAKVAFTTSTEVVPGSEITSVEDGDSLCGSLAVAAGYGARPFRAWLSDSGEDAKDRFNLAAGPYVRPDGALIADSLTTILTSGLGNPIICDEPPGHCMEHTGSVFTGTTDTGIHSGSSCSDWSINAGSGTTGFAAGRAANWTISLDTDTVCNVARPLYCFETD